ncbi:class I SAM-dependent methyltransferase [Streptomyces sp. NBC_00448]|uniref:class I SAM-dependent methyltransferase n=1 Tax=Streptomyces sp. NBC_00448 TaxID=2903652 RepID=UPI002E20E883
MATDTAGEARTDRDGPYDPALIARRARSFGAAAAAYAAHRPDYPVNGVKWALEPALASGLGAEGGTLDVLDLGAGTGKLSAVAAALGHRVTAVEPDPEMLGELRSYLPTLTTHQAGAEEIPLPNASVDAVIVGQALHWFDQSRALPEISRVLRPGGVLAALWNADDDRVEWIAGLGKVALSRTSFIDWSPGRGIQPHPELFPVEHAYFPHRQRRTADSMVDTIATHSHTLTLEPGERAELIEGIRTYLRSRPETASGEFDLEIITRVERSGKREIAGS